MRLIRPSFEILTPIETRFAMLSRIERAGRTCYKSEDKITATSCADFVSMIINRGHESVLEHEAIQVRIVCDRGVTHEIVRHRLASYSQESTRYCNYGSDHIQFIIPSWFPDDFPVAEFDHKTLSEMYEQLSYDEPVDCWLLSMLEAEHAYQNLIKLGWPPQQARSVLPNSLKTEIVMTANLREWRHFFKLRCSQAAHPQMREIAIPMLETFSQLVPIVFDDIVYQHKPK